MHSGEQRRNFVTLQRDLVLTIVVYVGLTITIQVNQVYSEALYSTDTYDFIVVGAGTAGCAVASRLSENGEYSVLLLEAGVEPDPRHEIPALTNRVGAQGISMRRYNTVPQENAGLENNGTVVYPVGYTLGGSSSVNGMMFNRGSPHDFDRWARVTGDVSWKYSNMLKYFKKSETYAGRFPSDQHGYKGPIYVSMSRYAPGLNVWVEAGRELGYPFADQNGPQKISFTSVESSKKFGRRVSSYTGYIKPFLSSRQNLRVISGAEVDKVEFDGDRAFGVRYKTSSTGRTVYRFVRASKEIIISAGVIGSPLLLQKSGIGPKSVLEAAKIPIIKHLPVGRNLHDHAMVILQYAINNSTVAHDAERDLTPESLRYFNKFGDGPYSSYDGASSQAFIASSKAGQEGNRNWADLHFFALFSPITPGFTEDPREAFNLAEWETAISSSILVVRPKSRGQVSVNVTDMGSSPVVDFQYLSHPDDIDVMVEGIKKSLQIHEQTLSFKRLGARLLLTPPTACQHLKFRSDDFWRCFVRQRSVSGVHGGGSCKMGAGPQDPTAVVDSHLRVIGLEGLRVVDASVMPAITNANLQAAVYGIAEKASDVILRSVRMHTPFERQASPKRFG